MNSHIFGISEQRRLNKGAIKYNSNIVGSTCAVDADHRNIKQISI